MNKIVISIPLLLPLPNQRRGVHWSVLYRERKRIADEMRLNALRVLSKDPFPRARVTVWRHSLHEPDTDNLYASCKHALDILQPCTPKRAYGLGMIENDKPSCCDLRAFWIKTARRTDQRTVIEVVEWLDAAA